MYTIMHFTQGILILFYSVSHQTAFQFHEELSPAERLHYFGTQLVDQVPHYHYTHPEPVQRRRRSADEPDLEYMVDIFGKSTHLLLEKNRKLISPGCIVHHLKANGTKTVYPCQNEVDCFYTGRTSNHSDSWVSASVCGGFHGVVGTVEKTFVVQPVRDEHVHRTRRDTQHADTHIVYLHKDKRSCADDGDRDDSTLSRKTHTDRNKKRRKRRSAARKYIETSVVVEPEVYKFHGNGTERFVKTVMNVAAERYLDPSLKTKLYMTLNKLVILEQSQTGLTLDKDSTTTLNSFCEWQSTWNPKEDSNPEHADYVLLLTRLDLEHNGNTANSGLARKGMCGEKTKCSINEDSGLGSGLIIAHETGHVLGMGHDGSGNSCSNNKYIMSSLAASGPDAFKWSQCSADTLKQALSTSELNCLNDQPPSTADKSYEASNKPGTIYTVNHQCRLMLGPTAEVCAGVHADGQDVCGSIVCRAKPDTGVKGCVIHSTPRMDGTDCGNRKWCLGGRCVNMGPGSPASVNGGWSAWDTHFTPCSRSCGGGVKVKRRYCNNPEPQYGGQPCSGSESTAELCNLHPCSTSQLKFKEDQCSATDSEPIQGHTYHWIPNDGALGDDSCKVSCQASGTHWYAKRGISNDGTECISDKMSTFSRCVGGKCKVFGCDGHMDSGKAFDQCAVCDGAGNTCTKVSGTFNGGTAKVFTTFVHIPTGSTGITITQGNGYCFLNIKVDGQNLFTADTPRSSGTFIVGGTTIKYSKNPERINIIGPTEKYLQAQVYRQYGPPYVGVDPDVYYEFHKPKSGISTSTYMWKTQAGACSKQCGKGTQVPVVTCVHQSSGTVADHFCNIYEKPKEETQPCNTQACPPRWRTGNWAQCSKTCGGGTRHRAVECVQENNNVEKVLSSSSCHGITKPSESSQCNTNSCPGVWKTGTWSACSETCARGTKTRDVKCYVSATSATPVTDSQCSGTKKPSTTENCVVKVCKPDISGTSCVDKVANCFQSYGDDVCTGQYKSWARDNCMKSCSVCSETPAASDPNCKDEISNCAQYQAGFCTNSAYASWAKKNCKQHCGYCGSQVTTTTTAAPSNPNCVDVKSNCKDYGASVCTQYAPWAKANCKAFCNLCEITTQPEDENVCADTAASGCEVYGKSVCSNTKFAEEQCRRYCGLCPAAACQDKESNCADYGASVCTQYRPWATEHCQGFCNLCGARRKRDVAELAPPLAATPFLAEDSSLIKFKLLEDEVKVQKLEDADDSIEDTESQNDKTVIQAKSKFTDKTLDFLEDDVAIENAEEQAYNNIDTTVSLEKDLDTLALGMHAGDQRDDDEAIQVPPRPVCNIVLTSPSDSIDVSGKLIPGVSCEQTIALPLDSRILLEVTNLNIDCDSGDSLTITDGTTNIVRDLCMTVPGKVWLSVGSIAAIRFVSSAEGHGYSFAYQSLPQNRSVSECSQHLTAAAGEVELIKFPASYIASDDTCEIYITGSPGKNVQLIFENFKMPGTIENCETKEGLFIEDLIGGETDSFCGELSPFIWESRGSRVRLRYLQVGDKYGFSASFSMQNI